MTSNEVCIFGCASVYCSFIAFGFGKPFVLSTRYMLGLNNGLLNVYIFSLFLSWGALKFVFVMDFLFHKSLLLIIFNVKSHTQVLCSPIQGQKRQV